MKTGTWNAPRVLVELDATRRRAVRRGAISRYLRARRRVEPMAIPRTHDCPGLSRPMSVRPSAGCLVSSVHPSFSLPPKSIVNETMNNLPFFMFTIPASQRIQPCALSTARACGDRGTIRRPVSRRAAFCSLKCQHLLVRPVDTCHSRT